MSFRLSWEINGQTVEVIGDYKTLKQPMTQLRSTSKTEINLPAHIIAYGKKELYTLWIMEKPNAFYKIEER
ncbi:hypothetical protein [Streptococcus equi]|uniref:hypothetical protein n=1 Tax=Streptococcus equi TaxID=1336 RepID=UPI00202DC7D5|nr:hypothetical protein [Streptococcus equi]